MGDDWIAWSGCNLMLKIRNNRGDIFVCVLFLCVKIVVKHIIIVTIFFRKWICQEIFLYYVQQIKYTQRRYCVISYQNHIVQRFLRPLFQIYTNHLDIWLSKIVYGIHWLNCNSPHVVMPFEQNDDAWVWIYPHLY